MKQNLFFIALLVVAGVLNGCSKETVQGHLEKLLVGTWQWVGTDGGFAYQIHHTPASTGTNIDLRIGAAGKYEIYTNGVLSSKGDYLLDHAKCIHSGTDKPRIAFPGSQIGGMIENLNDSILNLSDEFYDGVLSSFKRKN
jgi:hypothetical protein